MRYIRIPQRLKIKHPGALTRKAKKARMTIDEFANKHCRDKDLTGKQARFYINVLKR
jgi:hypothetical protein